MVRTHPPVVPLQIDVSRVLGWSTALALHLLALMLLLIPAAYVAAPLPRDRTDGAHASLRTAPMPKAARADQARGRRSRWSTRPPPPRAWPRCRRPPPPPTTCWPSRRCRPARSRPLPWPRPTPSPPAGGEGVQLQYRSAPPPTYPIAAIRDGQQGTVLLRVQVDPDGKAASVVIERSSGSRVLDNAARQQVLRHWRFVPAQVDGQAVAAVGLVPVSFSLPD
jgi:protein TonB